MTHCRFFGLQLLAARIETTRLSEENKRFRSMLTHLTSEYHNLKMHVLASSTQRHIDSAPTEMHAQYAHAQTRGADSRPESTVASPEKPPSPTSFQGTPTPSSSADHENGWQANKAQKIAHNTVAIPNSVPITQVEADPHVKKARVSIRARSDAPTVRFFSSLRFSVAFEIPFLMHGVGVTFFRPLPPTGGIGI